MKVTRNLRLLAFVTLLCAWKTTIATIDFQNLSSRLVFDNSTALLLIKNQQKILGWSKLSMVKENGNVPATNWIEGYGNNVIIGPSGATKVPQTNLVVANSNAITYLGPLVSPVSVPTADSINGTLWPQYQTRHHVFHNNGNTWTSRGFVRFNDGFTIMPRASVLMDTVTSVSGGMDLRDTGTLILAGDLYLAHNVTLTNGGNIKGRTGSNGPANTIFMGGDLTLASTTYARTLHITGDWQNNMNTGDLIIDGCGHTLNIGDRTQIFVDQNVTLTLRNMTIKTGPKSLNNPAIQLASFGSKLTLDNVMFDLGADFHFMQGQIFVHNEVAVTGTSAFVYQSPKPSYITSGATWSFEQGTTFSVAPSTFTDCPFTVNSTYTSNNFIVFADASSALSLNGCSFQTTFTGLRLRSGMVLFDNKVAIDTQAGVIVRPSVSVTQQTSVGLPYAGYSIAWSPNGQFIALVNRLSGGGKLFIYNYNRTTSSPTLVGSAIATDSNPYMVRWSPDGRFLAVVNSDDCTLQVFRFNGNSSPTLVDVSASTGNLSYPMALSWSPDGRFIAVGVDGLQVEGKELLIFSFDGASKPRRVVSLDGASYYAESVAWSPDGSYLFVSGSTTSFLSYSHILKFDGRSGVTRIGSDIIYSTVAQGTSWSPDGRFAALCVRPANDLLCVYRFNGVSTPMLVDSGVSITQIVNARTTWSPDGRFIAIYHSTSTLLEIYAFDGEHKPVMVGSVFVPDGGFGNDIQWSPDGTVIAISFNSNLYIYRCNYIYTGQPAQSFTNGLLFGDKAKGSSFNANVQVLDGATVTVKGMVSDDAA